MILEQAFRYITDLKKQNDAMLLERGDKVQGKLYASLCCSVIQNARIIHN